MPDPYPPHPLTPYPPLLINAALTGGVLTPERAPRLPMTTEEIVADGERAVAAGASIVHVHVRDAEGKPDWRKEVYADVITGLRERCPGVIVCATTTGRGGISIERRADVLALEGAAKPDMASLALGSFNFRGGPSITSVDEIEWLAAAIRDAGIIPELEVFDLGMVSMTRRLVLAGLVPERPYANLILGAVNTAPANARALQSLVDALPEGATWAAGGVGSFQRTAIALAAVIGGHVRTGLEDNPDRHDGSDAAANNAFLVEQAAAFGRALGREPMDVRSARAEIGL